MQLLEDVEMGGASTLNTEGTIAQESKVSHSSTQGYLRYA